MVSSELFDDIILVLLSANDSKSELKMRYKFKENH